MKIPKFVIVYVTASLLLIFFTKPLYDSFSHWVIFAGGTAGSLKLVIESIPDVYYEDLSLGMQFSGESFLVCFLAFVLWLTGGVLLYLGAIKGWKKSYIIGLCVTWVIGSIYNLFWMALRSL